MTETQSNAGARGSAGECRICGQAISSGVLICRECKYIRQLPRLHYFAALFLAPLAVPIVLLVISARMDSAKRTSESLSSLSREMKEQMSLAVDFDAQMRGIQEPCTSSETDPRKREVACLAFYMASLKAADAAVVRFSWAVDLLPIDADAYQAGARLKHDYWLPCDAKACGVRGQLESEIYRLRWCPVDLFADPTCRDSFGRLKAVATKFNDQAVLAFCHLRVDVNILMVRLYRLEPATREIADRLLKNSATAECTIRIGAAHEVSLARE